MVTIAIYLVNGAALSTGDIVCDAVAALREDLYLELPSAIIPVRTPFPPCAHVTGSYDGILAALYRAEDIAAYETVKSALLAYTSKVRKGHYAVFALSLDLEPQVSAAAYVHDAVETVMAPSSVIPQLRKPFRALVDYLSSTPPSQWGVAPMKF